jgi:hypothetical protein
MRPVDLQPGDGDRAIEEMRRAGAEIQEQEHQVMSDML